MRGACGTHGERVETLTGFSCTNLKERDHLEDLGVDRIVLKRNLNRMRRRGMD
jgi:hypothetical protein